MAALERGELARPCECPAHYGRSCPATSWAQCSCHRHTGRYCAGIIPLAYCDACKEPFTGPFLVLDCGCPTCNVCAVDALLSKDWAGPLDVGQLMEYMEPRDAEHKQLLESLIRKARSQDGTT